MTDTPQTTQDHPLVTFALFAYNQEKYIREAVEGAFSQTYEPLEIILSDDCSSDRTFEIMQEMVAAYEGQHEVTVRRNDTNLGLARHVNQIVASASGKYLVAAAGDDISMETRTEVTVAILQENTSATFCETAYIPINEDGTEAARKTPLFPARKDLVLADLLLGRITGLTGAARTYRLSAVRSFPPLNSECPTEDSPFVLRCLLCEGAVYIPDLTMRRRSHSANLSGAASLRTMNLNAIYAQYDDDINFAYAETKISKLIRRRTLAWAGRNMFKRKTLQQHNSGSLHPLTELWRLARKRSGIKERLYCMAFLFKVILMKRDS